MTPPTTLLACGGPDNKARGGQKMCWPGFQKISVKTTLKTKQSGNPQWR